MDARLLQARQLHQRATEYSRLADELREQRNRIMQALVAEGVTGRAIAAAIGCSPELVSHAVHGRRGRASRKRGRRLD